MKKNEVKKIEGLVSELKNSGIVVSPAREKALLNSASLEDFFSRAFGIKLTESLAGLSISVSVSDSNRAIRAANSTGKQTTRTRLIRYLTDSSFTARDGVKFDVPENKENQENK